MIEFDRREKEAKKREQKTARCDLSVPLITAIYTQSDLLCKESDLIVYYEQVFVSFII